MITTREFIKENVKVEVIPTTAEIVVSIKLIGSEKEIKQRFSTSRSVKKVKVKQIYLSHNKNLLAVVFEFSPTGDFYHNENSFRVGFYDLTSELKINHPVVTSSFDDEYIDGCLAGNGNHFYMLTRTVAGWFRILCFNNLLGTWLFCYYNVSKIMEVLKLYKALPSCGQRLNLQTSYDGTKLLLGEPCYGVVSQGRVAVFNRVGNEFFFRQNLALVDENDRSKPLMRFGSLMDYTMESVERSVIEGVIVYDEDSVQRQIYRLDENGIFQQS